MSGHGEANGLYGVIGSFGHAEDVIRAAHRVRELGYRNVDAYAPYPVEGLAEAVGTARNRMSLVVLLGAVAGGLGGYFLQYWAAVISYPIDVAGRPLHSWPAFVPITFEMTVLFGGLAGAIGMILLNGLPRLYHPVFNAPGFSLASRDTFFLCIEAADPLFDGDRARRLLEELGAREVGDVPL